MNYKFYLIGILFLSSFTLTSQEMSYDIRGTWGKPIPQENLSDAKTMTDINPGYPSSWIDQEDYISAEVTTIYKGEKHVAKGDNDVLNADQRKLIHNADIGSDIKVEVKYHVRDFLKKKVEVKTLNFGLTVVPSVQATYIGGREALMDYLRENMVDLLPPSEQEDLKVAMIKFTVDETGKVTQPIVSETTQNEEIDNVIQKAINQMPDWNPAQDANGNFVPQSFEFVIGNSLGC